MFNFIRNLFGESYTLTSGEYTTRKGTTVPFYTYNELDAACRRGVVYTYRIDKAGVDLVGESKYTRRVAFASIA